MSDNSARRSLLLMLTAAFALSYLDRQILNITLHAIGQEFALTDLQLGSLSGLAFAVVYVLFGFIAARWSRPGRRKLLVTGALAVWSMMTAAMGLANSYIALFLARVGVGIGEAGCVPPSHAMIADAYPPEKRAGALALFSAGSNIGVCLAFLVGGLMTAHYGWRAAFLVAGLSGLPLVIIMLIGLREPSKPDATDVDTDDAAPTLNYKELVRGLWRDISARHALLGTVLTTVVSLGALAWISVYLIRVHGLGVAQAGTYLALTIGVLGGLGTYAGGVIADRLGRVNPTWPLIFVAGTIVLAKPLAILFYLSANTSIALIAFAGPAVLGAMFAGPTFAHLYGRVPRHARPMVTALMMFLINLVGLGLGPIVVGALSDWFAPSLETRSLAVSLALMQGLGLWAAFHFWKAGRAVASPMVFRV